MSYTIFDVLTQPPEPCPVCTQAPCPTPTECEVTCYDWLVLEQQGVPVRWPLGTRPMLSIPALRKWPY